MAKKSEKMDFHWNYGSQALVQKKGFGKNLNDYFANTLVEYAEPFTPKLTGKLRNSVVVKATNFGATITYPGATNYKGRNYAEPQYFADDSEWNRNTPGTTSGWLDYTWTVYKQQITGKVGAYRRWHSN